MNRHDLKSMSAELPWSVDEFVAFNRRSYPIWVEARERARSVRPPTVHEARGVTVKVMDVDRPNLRLQLQRSIRLWNAYLHGAKSRKVISQLGLKRQATDLGELQRGLRPAKTMSFAKSLG